MSTLRTLCVLSVFFGLAMELTPEGGVRKILSIVCAAALLSVAAGSLKETDDSTYALELARYRDREQELLAEGTEYSDRLSRLVIENEYEEYIKDKAVQMGVTLTDVQIGLEWNTEGLWVPVSVTIRCRDDDQREQLSALITAELGIPPTRQLWQEGESLEEDPVKIG